MHHDSSPHHPDKEAGLLEEYQDEVRDRENTNERSAEAIRAQRCVMQAIIDYFCEYYSAMGGTRAKIEEYVAFEMTSECIFSEDFRRMCCDESVDGMPLSPEFSKLLHTTDRDTFVATILQRLGFASIQKFVDETYLAERLDAYLTGKPVSHPGWLEFQQAQKDANAAHLSHQLLPSTTTQQAIEDTLGAP